MASPLSVHVTNGLEHTELLADVGETLGLLGLVVNDVESHGLGEGSTHEDKHSWMKIKQVLTCTVQW